MRFRGGDGPEDGEGGLASQSRAPGSGASGKAVKAVEHSQVKLVKQEAGRGGVEDKSQGKWLNTGCIVWLAICCVAMVIVQMWCAPNKLS